MHPISPAENPGQIPDNVRVSGDRAVPIFNSGTPGTERTPRISPDEVFLKEVLYFCLSCVGGPAVPSSKSDPREPGRGRR